MQDVTNAAQGRWASIVEPIVEDTNVQLEKKVELQAEAAKVAQEINSTLADTSKTDQNEVELQNVENELRVFTETNEGRELDVDSLRDEGTPDHRQVLDCLAEEQALEEYLVALDELHGAGKIKIDDFLREVRDVSRRRFMCKVQRLKAIEALGVEEDEATAEQVAPAAFATSHAVAQAVPLNPGQSSLPIAAATPVQPCSAAQCAVPQAAARRTPVAA